MVIVLLNPGDQFHVGLVVEDFEETLGQLSALFGYEWCDETGGPVALELPTGAAVLDMRCTFSRTSPRLEIVRRIPGTLWEPVPGSTLHHIGYWSDDVAGDTAKLTDHGYVIEATRRGADGGMFFAFLRSTDGPRVELVTRGVQPHLEQHWAQPPATPGATTGGNQS